MHVPVITESTGILYAGQATENVSLSPLEADIPACKTVSGQTSLNDFLAGVQGKAYHVAYGALWEREVALDAVQESMLRFVEYYRNKPEKEWPALFRTVLNSKINDQRRKRLLGNTTRKLLSLTGLGYSRDDSEASMAESDLPQAAHDDGFSQPEAGATDGQLKQHIETALCNLAERQRQVFLLREQLGLSIRETSETLGCSENSIKQHHFRALRAMRKSLAEVWEHEHA
jgi:RNA polymerase sigma-70 factor (ECF subfamily)